MSLRFICPHCRVSVDPAAMEVSQSESAEFRVCPACDTPVLLALRCEPNGQPPASAGTCMPSGVGVAHRGADLHNSSKTPA